MERYPYAWLKGFVKASILPNTIYRFNAMLPNAHGIFYKETEKILILKFIWNIQGTPSTKRTLRRTVGKNCSRKLKVSYLLISKLTTNYSNPKQHKDRHIDQRKDIRNKPYIYRQIIFNKRGQEHSVERIVFSTNFVKEAELPTC